MSNGQNPQSDQVVLLVLDGWGYSPHADGNAIELARTPTWHRIWESEARTLLEASGPAVGLPEGQMGNSEVGHMNLGAGRVVPQDIVRIDQAVASGALFDNDALVGLCRGIRERGGTLHLMGLLGYGGVHAIDRHLIACMEMGIRAEVPAIAIHGFLDGRDSPPTSGEEVVRTLEEDIARVAGGRAFIATLTGRYYAMDRDKRWDRTQLAYEAMIDGVGVAETDPETAVRHAYERGETDEFIRPLVITDTEGRPRAKIRDGDGILCFNFRSDRMRQIVRTLVIDGFDDFPTPDRPSVSIASMTQYDQTFPVPQVFPPHTMVRIVGEMLADFGRTQFRTAETEKYAHVTYFFNGGHEPPMANEERCLVPSRKDVATYDLAPQMSAVGITDALCQAIEARNHDFLLCNYANPDMVGHTGVQSAIIEAVETVDQCLARVLTSAEATGARVLITADHGNCEVMVDPVTGGPHTAHTTNPVPLVALRAGAEKLRTGGALCDVGPTVLRMLGIEQPPEMTGQDLRES
jgi:2,3-bisphosphoglycerate-independent phosphoglycerate mutase